MEENEKIIEFLISPEFYNDWFLLTTKSFNIESTENFLKFVAILQFLDGWVRENWSATESQSKAKEIMQPVGFSEEEIDKILEFINQNFGLKREELWQETPETSEIVDDFAEKEKRYIEFMKTLVKQPVVIETNEETSVPKSSSQESFVLPESKETLTIQEKPPLKSEEKETEEIQPKIEEEKELKPTETDIHAINFEPLTETMPENSIESLDNIVITKKKEEEKIDEDKFLDLSNL